MTFLIILFLIFIIIINIIIALYESLKPENWLLYLRSLIQLSFFPRVYAFFLFVLFLVMSLCLIQDAVFARLKAFVWIIDLYILLSAGLFFFFPDFVREAFESFVEELDETDKRRMVYLESFLRLIASFIIIASMIP